LVEQGFCLFQVGGVESFGKPASSRRVRRGLDDYDPAFMRQAAEVFAA
jgi:hypothetical protein